MITGGAWEIDLYPHLPEAYERYPENTIFRYFVNFNNNILQCNIVQFDDCSFTYIHRKDSEIRHPESDIIFETEYDPRPNHVRNMLHSTADFVRKLYRFFRDDKVFYQDNEVGEVIRNYLMFCQKEA